MPALAGRHLRSMRTHGSSKCSNCRTRPATRPSGLRTSRATRACRRAVRLQSAHAQPANRSRKSPPARYSVCRAGRTLVAGGAAVPPMFTPFRLRELELRNRVVVSPMDMYSAVDGMPNDFHLVHLGSARARRRRAGVHRDDLRHARRPHFARLHRHVSCRARRGVEAHRRLRARVPRCEDLPAVGPFRAQRLDQTHVGGHGRTARRRQLAGRRAVGSALRTGESNAARTDARRDGRDSRRVRARDRRWGSRPVSI